MKVIGYLGSPRRGGNTETLLDAILAGARAAGAEAVKVPLAARKFSGCQSCGGCDETGRCIVTDQMQPLYEGLMPRGDPSEPGEPGEPGGHAGHTNLVLATPVFFGGISAQAKAMIDRCQCLWVRKYRLHIKPPGGRRALLAAVCGMPRPSMFEAPLAVARIWFTTLGTSPLPPFLVPEVDARGDLARDGPTLERARAAGVWLGGGPEPSFRDRAPGFLRGQTVWLRPRRPADWSEVCDPPDYLDSSGPDCQEWAIVAPKYGVCGGLRLVLRQPVVPEVADLWLENGLAEEGIDPHSVEVDAKKTISAYAASFGTTAGSHSEAGQKASNTPATGAGEKGNEKR